MSELSIQIDVKEITESAVKCNMYTDYLCVPIVMNRSDYDYLVHKGFFIRDGKEKDSAGVMNTTHTYTTQIA